MTTLTHTVFRAGRLGAFAFTAALLAAAPARAQSAAPASSRVWDAAEVSERPQLINERHMSRLIARGYPKQLLDFGVHGRALLQLTVGPTGRVEAVEGVDATQTPFGDAAVAFAWAMRFAPATRDGAPVRCRVTVPVDFAIANG